MRNSNKTMQLEELETIVVLATFLLVLYICFHCNTFLILSIVLMLIGLFVKPVAAVISRLWLKFAELLGTFNSKVILTVVFFLFLTPIAIVYRKFSKNKLHIKIDKDTQSFFVERNHLYNKSDFEKTW